MRWILVWITIIAAARMSSAAGLPEPIVPDALGVNIHFAGKQEAQVKKIAEAGFKFIRMDINWQRTETKKGEYDFKASDELVSSLAERVIRPLLILDYGNPLYDDGLAPHTDKGRAAFAKFAGAAALRYKGKGIIWEIWNEPNQPAFWKPGPNVSDYVELAKVAYEAIKKSDPNAVVIGPALSAWDFGFLEAAFQKGLLGCVDAVSVHPYGSSRPEDAFRYYDKARTLIKKYAPAGKNVPVASGEWGYASAKGFTTEKQAQYLAREFLTNLMNAIPLSIWYDWRNDGPDPNDPEHNCGVIDANSAEKPAYKAMQTLARELDGFRFAACIDAGSDDDYLALFTKGDDVRLAAWTTGPKHVVSVPVDVEKFDSVSLLGEHGDMQAHKGKLDVELSGSVRYITPAQKSPRWQIEAGWRVGAETVRENGAMSLRIESSIASEVPYYEFFNGHNRLQATRTKLEKDSKGGSVAVYSAPYVSNGEAKGRIKVIAKVLGLAEPLTRSVGFENSVCPNIEVLPPTADTLLLAVSQPESGTSPGFEGRLFIGNYQGIRLESDSFPIKLRPGDDRQIVRLKMTQTPGGVYSFSCRLAGDRDQDIAKLATQLYSLVETFAGGKAGEAVSGFGAVLGGDAKALGEAKLTYVDAPRGAPSPVCGKLEYRFDPGWKYVQVVPRSAMRIPRTPRFVRIWLKGEGNGAPAYIRYAGKDGQTFQEGYGGLDSAAWRCYEADMTGAGAASWGASADGVIRYPLSWNTLVLIDNPGKAATAGTVYIGPMMLCYD